MMRKNKKQLLCVLCALSLFLFSSCKILSPSPKTWKGPTAEHSSSQTDREPYTKRHYSGDIEHFDIPLEERPRDSFDKRAFLVAFFEFKDIIQSEYDEANEAKLLALL